MSRDELKEIIRRVIVQMQDDTPQPACLFGDGATPCDTTTRYAVGEEA